MCCLTTVLLVFGSRITIFVWWLMDSPRFNLAFQSSALPAWACTLLGGIFLPWTTLAYLYVFPKGVQGFEWIILGIALLIDLAGHSGTYRNRNRFSQNR